MGRLYPPRNPFCSVGEQIYGRERQRSCVSFDISDTKVSVIGSETQRFVKALDVLVFFVALLLALPPFVAAYRSMSQVPQGEVVQTDSSAGMTLD